MTIKELINELKKSKGINKPLAIRKAYLDDYGLRETINKVIRQEEFIIDRDDLDDYLSDSTPLEISIMIEGGNYNSERKWHRVNDENYLESFEPCEYDDFMMLHVAKKDITKLLELVKKYNIELYNYINTLE